MNTRTMYVCPDCQSQYVSNLAASECCNPVWEPERD